VKTGSPKCGTVSAPFLFATPYARDFDVDFNLSLNFAARLMLGTPVITAREHG